MISDLRNDIAGLPANNVVVLENQAKLAPLRPIRTRVRTMLDEAGLVPSAADIARCRGLTFENR